MSMVAAVAVSCVPPTIDSPDGVTVSMDAAYTGGFFSLPWPNDIRRTAAGTLDLTGFPGADERIELLLVSQFAANELRGFGTQTAVYLRLTGPIDPATLPSPTGSIEPDSSVQLVDLDEPTNRIPVIVRVEPTDRHRPPNLLSLLPYPGHTLRPNTRYAAVVTSGVRDAAGAPLAEAPLIDQLDDDHWLGRARSEQHWIALRAQRDAVRAALAAGAGGATDDTTIAGFTVFRTADSTREMRAVAAAVEALPPAPIELLSWYGDCDAGSTERQAYGSIALPDFQNGTYPFTLSGGGIVIGADGVANVQRHRPYPIALRAPCGETPEDGWPIETFVDGTGGSAHVYGLGFVDDAIAAGIPPLFGVGTGIENPYDESTYYNVINPQAARANPIQQSANHLALIKALRHLELPGAEFGSVAPLRGDGSRVMIGGQSQGAQSLPMVAAFDDGVVALISGAGVAGFYNQVSYRTWGRQQLGAYTGVEVLDIRNPWAQLVGTVADLGEPANYPNDAHQLNFAGKIDGCVPLEGARHFAASMQLTVSDPQWGSVMGAPSLDPPSTTGPVSANVDGRTKVSVEAPGGHFIAYSNTGLASAFTADAFAGRAPTVPAGPHGSNDGNCEPRWGEIGHGT